MNFAYELMDLCRGTQEVEAVARILVTVISRIIFYRILSYCIALSSIALQLHYVTL